MAVHYRDDIEEIIEATNVAVNERGAYTRVFGRSIRLPEGTADHDDVSIETISRYQAKDGALSRSIQYRMAARQAYVEVDMKVRWERAMR